MRVRYGNFTHPLWDDLGTIVLSYRGFYAKQSKRQRKLQRLELLKDSLTDEYQSAHEIAKAANVPFHQAVKLLQIAVERLDTVECKQFEYVDHKKRHRAMFLYRKKQENAICMIKFGRITPPIESEVRQSTVHRCEDD